MFQALLTTRNVFIANLAISDLLLCIFTMPLTLADLLTKVWALSPNLVSGFTKLGRGGSWYIYS